VKPLRSALATICGSRPVQQELARAQGIVVGVRAEFVGADVRLLEPQFLVVGVHIGVLQLAVAAAQGLHLRAQQGDARSQVSSTWKA